MINAFFDGSCRSVSSQPAYLHDYGQTLRVVGLNLPSVVEAHFALEESGGSTLRAGSCSDGITTIPIPDSFLEEVGSFFCYIFDRGDTSGRTIYKIKIPVLKRADMPTETTEPSEQDVAYFEQVLAQMTAQTDRILNGLSIGTVETLGAGENATASITADGDTFSLNLGIPQGERGEDGEDGKDGAGGGVGESTAGQSVTYNNTDYTCGTGAERFSDYASNLAIGRYSHAEGSFTKSIGNFSHAEGGNTTSSGIYAHAEGSSTTASGASSHAEGTSARASGDSAHAEGYYTYASSNNQHAQGRYNIVDSQGKYIDIVGNGNADSDRSNAETTDWTGVKWLKKDVRCGGSNQDSAEHSLSSKADKLHVAVTKIEGDSASSPTADKTYEQIMAAVQEGAEIICTYTVQLVYGGEIEQEITQHLQFVRADEYNIHFGFCGWGLQMGKYRLSAHAIDISAYNDITVYDSSVEIATAANITTLTSRISQLEARVSALEGGN